MLDWNLKCGKRNLRSLRLQPIIAVQIFLLFNFIICLKTNYFQNIGVNVVAQQVKLSNTMPTFQEGVPGSSLSYFVSLIQLPASVPVRLHVMAKVPGFLPIHTRDLGVDPGSCVWPHPALAVAGMARVDLQTEESLFPQSFSVHDSAFQINK